MRKVVLGPNAVYLADPNTRLFRCRLDPATGLVTKSDGSNFDCRQQGNSSGQFTVGGAAYIPTSILFY
jgi:hypothetical protein